MAYNISLSTRYALDYLGIFERLNNPNFNITEFGNIRSEAGSNGFVHTNAVPSRVAWR